MKKILLKAALLIALFSVCLTGCSMGGGADGGAAGVNGGGNGGGGGSSSNNAVDKPISGTLTSKETWAGSYENGPITYYINSQYKISSGGTLEIKNNAIVKLDPNGSIILTGTAKLVADGVIFTSSKDHSRGRKILAAGEATPAPGDWKQIKITNGAYAEFKNCEFSYGGNACSTVYIANSTTKSYCKIDNCLFRNNAGTDAANSSVYAALKYDGNLVAIPRSIPAITSVG